MNRIIREHYPVADLPEDLREGFAGDANVRVTIEVEPQVKEEVVSLDELFAMARPSFASAEEALLHIRAVRRDWD